MSQEISLLFAATLVWSSVSPAFAQLLPAPAPAATGAALPLPAPARELLGQGPRLAEAPLFHVFEDRGYGTVRRLAALKLSQLGRPFLFTAAMGLGLPTGSEKEAALVAFRLAGDRVLFVRLQTKQQAPAGTPERLAIERSVPDELLATTAVISSSASQGTVVFALDPLLLSDPTRVGALLQRHERGKLAFSAHESGLERLSVFPKNAEFSVRLVFLAYEPGVPQGLERRVPVTMRYGLSDLPENPGFEPRTADPRVGYFTAPVADLADSVRRGLPDPVVERIARWDLRKKDPTAAVSEVENPIVFWLDETVPHRYRDAVASGVLAWNAAFEAVGLKGAIQVKSVDRDMPAAERAAFDAADVRYNVIRWIVTGAMGEAGPRVNPLTGQILSATIRLGEWLVRDALDSPLLEPAGGASVLSGAERERFSLEGLVHTVMHEMGHVLGLRHNFKASLHADAAGGTPSVMDYSPARVPVPAFRLEPGRYDRWAIEYGYASVPRDGAGRERALSAIASRADSEPELAFATDEDADGADPDVRSWDQGRGLEFAEARAGQVRRLWRRLEADPALDPGRARAEFDAGLRGLEAAAGAAAAFIGGTRGTRGVRTPVPAAEQRRALAWLAANVFSGDVFLVDPALLARLAKAPSEAEPLPARAAELQRLALERLYAPATLQRLADAPHIGTDPSGVLSLSEMSDLVRRAVWDEAAAARPVEPLRRSLQRAHIDVLGAALRDPQAPADGRVTVRRDLERIVRDADAAAAWAATEDVRAYYFDAGLRARRALDERSAPSPAV